MCFCAWLIDFTVSSGSVIVHVVTDDTFARFFFCFADQYSLCTYTSFYKIHYPLMDAWAVVNDAAVNEGVHTATPLPTDVHSLGYVASGRYPIVGWMDPVVLLFLVFEDPLYYFPQWLY